MREPDQQRISGDNGHVEIHVEVLGPVVVRDAEGAPIAVGSRRRRELLGRLVAAGGRPVPLGVLVADLWEDRPHTAAGTVRTFVAELRRALEPDRPPRSRSHVIETVGTGYALRVPRERVDAHRFEDTLRAVRDEPGGRVAPALSDALSWWTGEPYADLDASPWLTQERARLAELHRQAVELRARAELDLGRGAPLVPELDAFAATHAWREQAWVLLAHALYQADRQVDALASLRDARARLLDRYGLESADSLDHLERDILRHAPHLRPAPRDEDRLRLLTRTEATGTFTRLRSMSTVAGAAAITGGANLVLAQDQRAAAVAEAERTGDPVLTARVIAAYDVPTIWTRADDPGRSQALVATTRRTLDRLGAGAPPALRARLLATIGLEHRGTRDRWAAEAATEAERLARDLQDAGVLALALNARFVQSFQHPGRTGERDAVAGELIELSTRHDLPTFEVLGHLIKIQVHAARGDLDSAEPHVVAAERLATIHETPLVHVLTGAFRAMRLAARSNVPAEVARAYRAVAADLAGAGMPGVEAGLFPLALLSLRMRHRRPAPTDPDLDWGPYRPWVQPLLDHARGDLAAARRAAGTLPRPAADHLYDSLWAVNAHTAVLLQDDSLAARAREALHPLRGEIAGGTTAMITFGPVDDLLVALDRSATRTGENPSTPFTALRATRRGGACR
ncbi:DNA-binding SARP family transcriptional activator [Pseudonocardia hierapolitana]|uniref:DNA-binding SARP family transcriptional activator n=1 Tax=Pseudonocardia hierapolitana TaxID=1128676 RepID=A0A561SMN9_9PSEU|nr:AfsR/SARP family transcriptional regulator [Pseudonocardia hierapolitana]TWF76128.1 DNA-binding SARP family transcriptional activator [Pseudonocardia hierapolitana]